MKRLKRALAFLLCMIMAVSAMCFVTPVGAAATDPQMVFTDENVDSYVGKNIVDLNCEVKFGENDVEKVYGGVQCVDYAVSRAREKLKIKRSWLYSGNGRDMVDCAESSNGDILCSYETGKLYRVSVYKNDGGKNIKANSWVCFESPSAPQYGHVVFVEYVKTASDGVKYVYYTEGGSYMFKNGTAGNLEKVTMEKFLSGYVNSWTSTYRGTVSFELVETIEPTAEVTSDNTKYAYYSGCFNWKSAKNLCEKFGGHLATITSAEEQGIVAGLASKAGKALWIGATRDASYKESEYYWITGESFEYRNWKEREPTKEYRGAAENCVAIYASGKWNDVADSSRTPKGFICEWDTETVDGVFATDSSELNGEFYLIPAVNGKKAIDIYAQKKEAQAIAHLWDFHGGDSQKFRVTHVGDYIVLTNVNSNKSLDVKWGSRDSGAQVWQWGTHNGNSQKWLPTYCGDGTFELKSALGNYLDANGGNSDNGTKIQVWTGNGTAAQKWKFRYVNAPCSHSYSYGNDSAHPHNRYKTCTKCGEKSYTGETGYDSSCSTCNPVHIHSWVTGTEKAHPHRNYKYCDECGEKTYTDDGNYRSSCDECNPDTECVHNWNYYNKSSHPHKEYRECSKCGEVQYTGNTGYESSCSKCNVCNHSWNYYNESAHPHKEYKECSKCGETKYTGATGSVDSCGKCHPVTDSEMTRPCEHNWKYYTESSHPHEEYKKCTSCGEKVYTGATEYKSNCSICNPPDERDWRDWSEWSTSYVESSETRQVQTKTQYVYYHYLLTYDDNNVGTYPINMATANYNFRNFVNAHVKAESYHEFMFDSPMTVRSGGVQYTVNGSVKGFDRYDNVCTQDHGNFNGNLNGLFYKGTVTVYRYRDFK